MCHPLWNFVTPLWNLVEQLRNSCDTKNTKKKKHKKHKEKIPLHRGGRNKENLREKYCKCNPLWNFVTPLWNLVEQLRNSYDTPPRRKTQRKFKRNRQHLESFVKLCDSFAELCEIVIPLRHLGKLKEIRLE